MLFIKEEENATSLFESFKWTVSPLSWDGGCRFLHFKLHSRFRLAGGIRWFFHGLWLSAPEPILAANFGGLGSLVVKVTDSSHEFEPCSAEYPPSRGGQCTLNMSRLKRSLVDVVWKLGEGYAGSGVVLAT
ncbi:hypothetical protein TNCV_3553251 [Trichonephila clavipes]|nr:hypothetical protein TNCV_3553251 [Trichonephila clavipes]